MKDEKCLLVLGASSDVGSALIREISTEYCHIFAHYNHGKEQVFGLQQELGDTIIPLQADLSKEDDVTEMLGAIAELGYWPDHIVHLSFPKTVNKKFVKHSWEEYSKMLETSVHSLVIILQKLLPHMQKQHYGKVVLMLTSYVCGNPPKYQAPYVATKYMLLGLMKELSVEYADKGITVNGVSPDMMETKFLEDIPDLIVEQNAASNPLGRNIKLEDVIPAFTYLLSDQADAITGQNLLIAGGKV